MSDENQIQQPQDSTLLEIPQPTIFSLSDCGECGTKEEKNICTCKKSKKIEKTLTPLLVKGEEPEIVSYKEEKEYDYHILRVDGGAGKNVMFTAVTKVISRMFPYRKLIVIASYPEFFLNLPWIYRVYRNGQTPYLWEDYVKNQRVTVNAEDPYYHQDYLLEKDQHFINTWLKAFGIDTSHTVFNNDDFNPCVKTTLREKQSLYQKLLQSIPTLNEKPILLFQPFGGGMDLNNPWKYNWNRDIPYDQAVTLVQMLAEQYHIIQIGHEKQPLIPGAYKFTGTWRELASLVELSHQQLVIDSVAQHLCAAFNKRAHVCWITNKPSVFGYDNHIHYFAKQPENFIHTIDSLFQKDNWSGEFHHYYPYKDFNLFNVSEIVESIFQQKSEMIALTNESTR